MRSIIGAVLLMAVAPGLAFATPAAGRSTITSDASREFAVASGLQSMLQQPATREQLGHTLELAQAGDVDRLAIGTGVRVHTIDATAIRMAADIKAAIRSTDSWRYILSVDGVAVGLATVEPTSEGNYRLVDIGARHLATSLAAAVGHQPAGSHPFLLRSMDTRIDLLAVDATATGLPRYTRLTDTSKGDQSALGDEELATLLRDNLAPTH
jgi:hypothetical protein